MPNYTNRTTTFTSVKKLRDGELVREDGWCYWPPKDVYEKLSVGDSIAVETRGFSRVTGIQNEAGEWLFRKSDEDLDEEDRKFLEDMATKHRRNLEKNRSDWSKRTYVLPPNIRARIDTFRERAGERFDLDGWGYELVIAELIVLFVEAGKVDETEERGVKFEDSEKIETYIRENGCSGNQVEMAKVLARELVCNPAMTLGGTISAMFPITGSLYYN